MSTEPIQHANTTEEHHHCPRCDGPTEAADKICKGCVEEAEEAAGEYEYLRCVRDEGGSILYYE